MAWSFKNKTTAPAKPVKAAPPVKTIDLDKYMAQSVADPAREQLLKTSMQQICADNFPDNEGNIWSIKKVLNRGKTAFVMMEPDPKDVGSDLFVFFLRFSQKSGVEDLTVYSREQEGNYDQLCTADNCPDGIPQGVHWAVG